MFYPRRTWTEEQDNIICQLYPNATRQVLTELLHRNFNAIKLRGTKLGIKRPRFRCSMEENFMKFVIPEPNSGCWLWDGPTGGQGYGVLLSGKKTKAGWYKQISGHRASWIIHRGHIPLGMCVLHHCDIRICVNPDHLFLGTKADNNQDCHEKKRHRYGEKHPNSKLTNHAIVAIRKSTESSIYLAKLYHVDRTLIWLVRRKKIWKHL